jgi:hypothetical protein
MFVAAPFTAAKKRKLWCPPSAGWLRKMWCISAMEYYTSAKRKKGCHLQHQDGEQVVHAFTSLCKLKVSKCWRMEEGSVEHGKGMGGRTRKDEHRGAAVQQK